MKLSLILLVAPFYFFVPARAMQEIKDDLQNLFVETGKIEFHLHYHLRSTMKEAQHFTLNISEPEEFKKNNDITQDRTLRNMIAELLNRQAQNLVLVQLKEVKRSPRIPKTESTAHKVITLFAYEK